jgi:hypothetical protein
LCPVFAKAGLSFPKLPAQLAATVKQCGEWAFSTRLISMSPYNLEHYVSECGQAQVNDYAVLSHFSSQRRK